MAWIARGETVSISVERGVSTTAEISDGLTYSVRSLLLASGRRAYPGPSTVD